MRFVVLGTSEFAIQCTRALLDSGAEVCSLISVPRHVLPDNSADIGAFAASQGLPYHEVRDINSPQNLELLAGYSPDVLLISWHRMLRKEALEVPRFCCIGTHPTALPFNRGRHPLHWLLALGISETKLSFFRMDEGMDTGNILLQVPFSIAPNESIADAVVAFNTAGYLGTKELYQILMADPSSQGIDQDQTFVNYWRGRTRHDVTLDLRMTSSAILRTVRSFAIPYPCANLIFEDSVIKISGASVPDLSEFSPEQLRRLEPGKLICAEGKHIRVKVDDNIVDLECVSEVPEALRKAEYIHPPTKYVCEWPGASAAFN